ncbi:unnamed protein product [Urochloa decumbens]|uniref:CASP-like protein n=1 Tax=Urochloa decumbens TaxID=240449 RepID=A0ABC9A185_9POAL
MAAMKLPELALRLCVIPLAVASLWEMASNSQADDTYGEVKFSNISGFTYLVGINAVTAAYALASILLSPFKSFAQYDWLILVLDQLARHGDRDVSWGEVCSYFGRFCGKATVSLALHAAALACFVALSLLSAFRVFSRCGHPHSGGAGDCSSGPKHAQEQRK